LTCHAKEVNGPDDYIAICGDEAMARIFDGREDGAQLLTDIATYIRKFVVLTREQCAILSVYILHTHVVDTGMFTPYIHVWSPVMRSGKTRLLELLQLFVHDPWMTQRASAAALVRKITKSRPTLLLDESDAAFTADKEYSEALRGMLNAGFQKSGVATLCIKVNGDWQPQDFPVFSPKVIAGIGIDKLPTTVRDRSIPIEMKRRAKWEAVEDFDTEDQITATRPLVERIKVWAKQTEPHLRGWPKPEKLEALSDRQRDICNPLLKIADLAGGGWLQKLSDALISVMSARQDDEGAQIKLLADIRCIFDKQNAQQLFSAQLVAELVKIETSPWAEWKHEKPMTPIQLARMLKSFRVYPHTVRVGTATAKGYDREDFRDAWGRYVPPSLSPDTRPVTPSQSSAGAGERDFQPVTPDSDVTEQECKIASFDTGCDDVTGQSQEMSEGLKKEASCYVHGPHYEWWARPGGGEQVCGKCHPNWVGGGESLGF
jgi:hypothetical protein